VNNQGAASLAAQQDDPLNARSLEELIERALQARLSALQVSHSPPFNMISQPARSLPSTVNPPIARLPTWLLNPGGGLHNRYSLSAMTSGSQRHSLPLTQPPIMATSSGNLGPNVTLPNRTLPSRSQDGGNPNLSFLPNQSLPFSSSQPSFLNLPINKAAQIISRWPVRFKGTSNDKLTIQEFLYRISALTTSDLQGDYQLLCNHISILLEDKASNWFWRYHAEVRGQVSWMNLCEGLVEEFKDRRTDEDVLDKIRARKQKSGERFDAFYDDVLRLNDRMVQRLSTFDLLPIIKRNLHPDLRKDLLYLPIHTMSQLREYVSKREIFDEDVAKVSSRSQTSSRHVAEIVDSDLEPQAIEAFSANRVPFKCWNCNGENHRWDDCPSEIRNRFCYGCGQPDVVKPKCPKCSGNSKNVRSPGAVLPPVTSA